MTIKAITFDFWSTLYKGRSVDYNQRLQGLKTAIEQTGAVHFELSQVQAAVQLARETWSRTWVEEHRTIGATEWLGIVLKELDVTLPADIRLEIERNMENSLLDEPPTLVQEANAVLAELAATYRLGIISDTGITPGRVLRQILAEDGIIDYFSHLTFSDELGRSKPHPEAFLTTLRHLDASPAQAIHIGDLRRTDIAGAKGVAMRAVQYIGISQDDEEIPALVAQKITPDAVISDHTELFSLLRFWNGGN